MAILDEIQTSIVALAEGAGAALVLGPGGGRLATAAGALRGNNPTRVGGGFYRAMPADEAVAGRVGALGRGESATPPRLGIAIAPGHVARRLRRAVGLPDVEGLLIREVTEPSPAARAGLAQGDLIVAARGPPPPRADRPFDAPEAATRGALAPDLVPRAR